MTTLALIRHGPTGYNAKGRIQGRRDVPLSEQGRALVNGYRIPPELEGFDWFSSPLSRATESAEILTSNPVSIDNRLLEMDWGVWEGHTLKDLRSELGHKMRENEERGRDFCPIGGESPNDVLRRIHPFLVEVGQGERDAAAVTHKGVIRAIFAAATSWNMLGPPPQKLNWSCAQLFTVGSQGHPTVLTLNLTLIAEVPKYGCAGRAQ